MDNNLTNFNRSVFFLIKREIKLFIKFFLIKIFTFRQIEKRKNILNNKTKKKLNSLLTLNNKHLSYPQNNKVNKYFHKIKSQKNLLYSQRSLFVLLKISKNQVIISPFYFRYHQRIYPIIELLENYSHNINTLSVIIYIGDYINFKTDLPILTFCKTNDLKNQILIPDSESYGRFELLHKSLFKQSQLFPFSERFNKVYWRGSPTGGDYSSSSFRKFPRVKLVNLSIKFPNNFDFRFTGNGQNSEFILPKQFFSKFEKPEKSLNYKYLIDVDGNCSTFSRLRWMMYTGSVVLKQNSNFVQWYYNYLKNKQNIIFVDIDYKSIKEAINRNKNNQLSIVKKSSEFAVEFFSKESSIYYLFKLLKSLENNKIK